MCLRPLINYRVVCIINMWIIYLLLATGAAQEVQIQNDLKQDNQIRFSSTGIIRKNCQTSINIQVNIGAGGTGIGAGGPEPGAGDSRPGAGGPDPGAGGPKPGAGGSGPGAGGPEIGTGGPAPGAGGQGPGVGGQGPGAGGQGPGAGGQGSGSGGPGAGEGVISYSNVRSVILETNGFQNPVFFSKWL
ncbi:hypothetical protein ACROYT_G012505 [Oculina patagonica]